MDIGIPRETRTREHRVALAPSGVKALVLAGHRVWIETGAGGEAGHTDAEYQSAGASIAFSRMEVFARAELVAGVYAPEARKFDLLHPRQTVLAFGALPTARLEAALQALPDLRRGVYLYRGRCVRPSLAEAFRVPCAELPAGAGA